MIRHNSQKYIKRTVLDIELIDSENGLRVIDLRHEFYNIDESRDKSQFGRITMENREIIDGGSSTSIRRSSSWFILPGSVKQVRQSVHILTQGI